MRLREHDGRAAFIGIGAVSGKWRELGGFVEGRVVGIEETLEVGGGDRAMRLEICVGIVEHMGETIDGRNGGHGGDGSAIVVGGALIVSAGLLVARGEREDGGIARETLKRLTQPELGLISVVGGEGCADGAFEIAG
jgi:hypothetical protein